MIDGVSDPRTLALLDEWQRGFPIEPRPFARIGAHHGLTEAEVLGRLRKQVDQGRITRVGATCAPNTVSASTLAAVAAADDDVDRVAGIISRQPGVNHNYLREDEWNLWFVVTGPDRAHVDATLARIGRETGLRVLDLPLVRPFNVDLGFSLKGGGLPPLTPRKADPTAVLPGDRDLLQGLLRGLDLVGSPYAALAEKLGRTEAEVLNRIEALSNAGIVSRLGIIIRHRAVGWRSNAMVVWDIPADQVEIAGPLLARQRGVTLCYERRVVPRLWPYRLFCMIHARSRAEALDNLSNICALPQFADIPHKVLFSLHCYRQTGAMIADERLRA
ncbi:Lrp/AsnC family transcriptional regulator [Thalassococcus sp. CAU 1522]|uniref:siroheme decarboxylase n=1 Tax=Thalassococcus arenae TaxID=2851652 RepID=A0ABS6NC89_9RHOB|nr:Lrp/AsnC family transcriptional regulator [Thalassococcus arenae]MBV2361645.1 Lrp/AsnC family transcriptional regulator [Thalassococcus arenae]